MAEIKTPLNGRTLHLKIDVIARPKVATENVGTTEAAKDVGERLSLELGLLAQRLAGEGYVITVEPQIITY